MKKQRTPKKLLSLMLAIVLAFAFMPTSSAAFDSDYEPEAFSQLNAPTGLRLSEDGILTWESVQGAAGYAVHINLHHVLHTENSFIDLWEFLTDDGIFTIRVRALSDGHSTLDSNLSDAFDVETPCGMLEEDCSSDYDLDDYDSNDGSLYKYNLNERVGIVAFSNPITFTCTQFEAVVRELVGKPTGDIYDTDVDTIVDIYAPDRAITSLDGIEHFIALESLSVGGNQLTELDMSNNIALESLFVGGNQLTELDLSNNTALTSLYAESNQLTELDVSSNIALVSLFVEGNQLTELDVSNNVALDGLSVDGNQLTELNVSNNIALMSLSVENNQLTELDVSNNLVLVSLFAGDNQLTELDLSNNTALMKFRVSNNQLTELDVSNNTELEFLSASWNNLIGLDVSNNVALDGLGVAMNFMTGPSDVIGWELIGLVLRERGAASGGTFIFWEQRAVETPPTPPRGGRRTPVVDAVVTSIPDQAVPLAVLHSPYLVGFPDGEIKGERYISREEAAVILFRIREGMRFLEPASEAPFVDVAAGRWSSGYIRYVQVNGLLSGYPDGTFRPAESMSRNEFAVLVLNLMRIPPVAEMPYDFPLTDVPVNWATSYIYAVFEAGFVRGFPDNTFRGNTFVTRAQAASMLNNALDRSPVASDWANITEMPFTDLRRGYWALYELLEASIEHQHVNGQLMLLQHDSE